MEKLLAIIHSKESVSAMVEDYDHVSLCKDGKELVRFYIKDLMAINEIISHFTKPINDRANHLSDALYPRNMFTG